MAEEAPKSEENQPPAADAGTVPQGSRIEPVLPHKSAHSHAHLPPVQGLLNKIKQRNVGRVAILYIVVCYVILEPFEMFFHLLELPAWTGRTIVLLMVLGFPAALLFAWIYEITPEGIRPSAKVDPQRSITRQTGRKLDRAIIAVLAIALTYFVADKFWISKRVAVVTPTATVAPAAVSAPASPVIPEKSVAVLPFVDMSEKKDQEYFADGLAEELIDRLTRIPGLRVPARTSSFYFKGKAIPISQIAQDLGVANVVEGSVRKDGNVVRITAQLIRADTNNHVWSLTYERPMQDIFKTQEAIATAIAGALRVAISDKVEYGGYETTSPEAFDLYLQAVSQTQRTYSTADTKLRLSKASHAVALDPSFSDGWSAVAQLSTILAYKLGTHDIQLEQQAHYAIEQALETGHASARIFIRAAHIRQIFDFDGRGAVSAYRRGIENDKTGIDGSACAVGMFLLQGDTARAVQAARKTVELDPFGESSRYNLAVALYSNGQLGDAEAAITRDLELDPEDETTMNQASYILIAAGKPQAALAMANRIEKSPEWRLDVLPFIYDALGRKIDADAALDELIKSFGNSEAVSVAGFYAHRGEIDQAFSWLQRAYSDRSPAIWNVPSDPNFNPLRRDARYSMLLKQLGLIN